MGLQPDFAGINDWLYQSLKEVLSNMVEQRRSKVSEGQIALENLDLVEQTMNAIKRDLGAI